MPDAAAAVALAMAPVAPLMAEPVPEVTLATKEPATWLGLGLRLGLGLGLGLGVGAAVNSDLQPAADGLQAVCCGGPPRRCRGVDRIARVVEGARQLLARLDVRGLR